MKYPREDTPSIDAFSSIRKMINDLTPNQLDHLTRNLPKVALRLNKDYVARYNLTPGDAVGRIVKMDKLSTVYFIVSQSKQNEIETLKLLDKTTQGKHPHYSKFLLKFMKYSVDKVTGKQVT